MWLPNGSLKIIDRKKNIFKLSQGEYIAPERIENILITAIPIAQIFVTGNSLKANLVCIVVLDRETIYKWLEKKGLNTNESLEQVCKMSEVNKLVLEIISELGRENKLARYEIPIKVHLEHSQFTVENNLMTPTYKIKRLELFKKYELIISNMYKDMC